MRKVTDPDLLGQLGGGSTGSLKPVTNQALLDTLNNPKDSAFWKSTGVGALGTGASMLKGAASIPNAFRATGDFTAGNRAKQVLENFDSLEGTRDAKGLRAFDPEMDNEAADIAAFKNIQTDSSLSPEAKMQALEELRGKYISKLGAVAEDIKSMPKTADSWLYKKGDALEDWAKETLPLSDEQKNSFSGLAGQGVGSAGTFVLGALINAPATALSGAFSMMGQQYDDALNEGATEDEASRSALAASGLGLLEVLPAGAVVDILKNKGFAKPIAEKIGKALGEGKVGGLAKLFGKGASAAAIGGGEEVAQQMGSNLIAQEIYDPEREIAEGVGQSAQGGAMASGILGTVAGLIGGKRGSLSAPNTGADVNLPPGDEGGPLKAGKFTKITVRPETPASGGGMSSLDNLVRESSVIPTVTSTSEPALQNPNLPPVELPTFEPSTKGGSVVPELPVSILIPAGTSGTTEASRVSQPTLDLEEAVNLSEVQEAPALTLPDNLAKAKPAYGYKDKRFNLAFESDLDKAAYIVGNKSKESRKHSSYQDWLTENNVPEQVVQERYQAIKSYLKDQALQADPEVKDLSVPALKTPVNQVTEPSTPTPIQPKVVSSKKAASTQKAKKPVSLLEFISRNGGVQDTNGDFKSMGFDLWHRQAPFRRKLLATEGEYNTPDDVVLRAWEAGYLPEFQERPTINDLQARMDLELRGKPYLKPEDAASTSSRGSVEADELKFQYQRYAQEKGIEVDEDSEVDDIMLALAEREALEATGEDADFSADQLEADIDRRISEIIPGFEGETNADIEQVNQQLQQTSATGAIDAEPATDTRTEALFDQSTQNTGGSSEPSFEGDQQVIPGAERISDRQAAERGLARSLKGSVPQKEPGEDGGLFDTEAPKQQSLLKQLIFDEGGFLKIPQMLRNLNRNIYDGSWVATNLASPWYIAERDTPFAKVFYTKLKQMELSEKLIDSSRRLAAKYNSLKNPLNADRMREALTLAPRWATPEQLQVLNKLDVLPTGGFEITLPKNYRGQLAKGGQTIRVSAEEVSALNDLRLMFDNLHQARIDAVATKYGIDGGRAALDQELAALNQESTLTNKEASRKSRLEKLKVILENVENSYRGAYVPLMRHGNYYITAIDKDTGEVLESRHIDVDERAFKTQTAIPAEISNVRNEYRLSYGPKVKIKKGFVKDNEQVKTNLPFLERLASEISDKTPAEYDAVLEDLLNKEFDKLKMGATKRAKLIAGYSPDFQRSTAKYIISMSNYIAHDKFANALQKGMDQVDDKSTPNVRKFAKKWMEHQDEAGLTVTQSLRTFSYLYHMAGSLTSGLLQLNQLPLVVWPELTKIAPMVRKGSLVTALGNALSGLRLEWRDGGFVINPEKVKGVSKDEKQLLSNLLGSGYLNPTLTSDLAALAAPTTTDNKGRYREAKNLMNAMMSSVGVFETSARAATALALHRIIKSNPAVLKNMDRVFGNNKLYQEVKKTGQYEDVIKFFLDNTNFRGGKVNTPSVAMGIGALPLQFAKFSMKMVENLLTNAVRSGPEGRRAALLTLGLLLLSGGLKALPGAEDMEKAVRSIAQLSGGDFSPEMELRRSLGSSEIADYFESEMNISSKEFANVMMSGPLGEVTGIDVGGRLGLGNVAPSLENPLDILGPAGSALGTTALASYRALSGNSSPAEFLSGVIPVAGLRNIAKATDMADRGLRTTPRDSSQRGNMLFEAPDSQLEGSGVEKLNAKDIAARGLGATTTRIADKRNYNAMRNYIGNKDKAPKAALVDKAVDLAIERDNAKRRGDTEEFERLRKEFNDTMKEGRDRFLKFEIKQQLKERRNPKEKEIKRVPKQKRAEIREEQSKYYNQ